MNQKFCFAFICGKNIKTETSFHQKFNFIIALVLSLNLSVFSKEFCTAFRENDHKISYAFQTFFESVIVMNGQYWTLEFRGNIKFNGSRKYKFKLQSTQSKECPLFTAEYSMAVFVPTEDYMVSQELNALLFKVTII